MMSPLPTTEPVRLIKARAAHAPAAPFNYDDLRRQCDDYVAQAQEHKDRLIAQAALEADEIRKAAYAEGLAAGRRAALAESPELIESRAAEIARGEAESRLATALPAFEHALSRLVQERERWMASWETSAIELAAAIAEKIIHRELSQCPALSAVLVREALQLAVGQPQVTIRVHSRDAALLRDSTQRALAASPGIGKFELASDDSIAPGGCVVETQHGRIDARIDTQLQRIIDELVDAPSS